MVDYLLIGDKPSRKT